MEQKELNQLYSEIEIFEKKFSLKVKSRNNFVCELVEMAAFLRLAERERVASYVFEIFYDSGGSTCHFTLDPRLSEGDEVARKLRVIAEETISQFHWFGPNLCHGRDLR